MKWKIVNIIFTVHYTMHILIIQEKNISNPHCRGSESMIL